MIHDGWRVWGGDRTEDGARGQAILTSVLRTAQQQDKDAFHVDLLWSPQPKLLDILPPELVTIAALPWVHVKGLASKISSSRGRNR